MHENISGNFINQIRLRLIYKLQSELIQMLATSCKTEKETVFILGLIDELNALKRESTCNGFICGLKE